MFAFVARRLLQAVATVVAVSILLFLLLNVLPGNAAIMMGDAQSGIDPLVLQKMQAEMGLDRPALERLAAYMGGLLQGDLGQSFTYRESVSGLIAERIWPSLMLAGAAMALAIGIGVPLGLAAAIYRGRWPDPAIMIVAVSGVSMPQFWLGLMLIYLFAVQLQWLPTAGFGDGDPLYLILPAVTLGAASLALLARTTRAAVLETMGSDFARTARAKGLPAWRVNMKHVMRNAMILILTTASLQFGSLMGQAVIVEKMFGWPGLGSLLVEAIFLRDVPVAQGCVLMLVLFFLAVNLITDLLYAVIDRRIQL